MTPCHFIADKDHFDCPVATNVNPCDSRHQSNCSNDKIE